MARLPCLHEPKSCLISDLQIRPVSPQAMTSQAAVTAASKIAPLYTVHAADASKRSTERRSVAPADTKFCFIAEIILRVIADGWTWTGPERFACFAPCGPASVSRQVLHCRECQRRGPFLRFVFPHRFSITQSGISCSAQVLIAVTGVHAARGKTSSDTQKSCARNHPELHSGACL